MLSSYLFEPGGKANKNNPRTIFLEILRRNIFLPSVGLTHTFWKDTLDGRASAFPFSLFLITHHLCWCQHPAHGLLHTVCPPELATCRGDSCFSREDTGELLEAPTLNVIFLHPHPAFSSQANEPE